MVKQLVIWYNNPENEIVRVNDLDLDIIWKIRKYLRSVSMAKTIKLPADLRDWKVTSFVGEDNGCEVYKVSRKIDKNTAQMRFSDTHLSAKAIIPMNVPSILPKRLILLNRLRSLTVFQTIWMFMFRIIRTKKPVICTYLQKNSQVWRTYENQNFRWGWSCWFWYSDEWNAWNFGSKEYFSR